MDEKILKVLNRLRLKYKNAKTHTFDGEIITDNLVYYSCNKCGYTMLGSIEAVDGMNSDTHINYLYKNIDYFPTCNEYTMENALE